MSLAFGWKEDYTKSFVIRLIQNGEMKARIDNERGMVVATNVDGRKEAFRKTIEEGVEIQRKAEALSYRSGPFPRIMTVFLPFPHFFPPFFRVID